jgi:hypothetical protein
VSNSKWSTTQNSKEKVQLQHSVAIELQHSYSELQQSYSELQQSNLIEPR